MKQFIQKSSSNNTLEANFNDGTLAQNRMLCDHLDFPTNTEAKAK